MAMNTAWIKRLTAAWLAAVCLLPAPLSRAAEISYWDLTADYYAAEKSGDKQAFYEACARIVEFYEPHNTLEGCERSFPPALKAANYCEQIGDYAAAKYYYTIYRDCLVYIDENTDINYYDAVRSAEAMVAQYSFVEPVVYTSAVYPADVPYFGETGEPVNGTYAGMCDTLDEKQSDAFLLYAHFGTEEVADFAWMLPQTGKPYLLEIAWNIPNESKKELEDVAAGKKDEYIIRNLKWMNTLSHTVLIRFAAEVNTWTSLPQTADENALQAYCDTYIRAFRHVAELARKHAPKAAMVYSPNDISNWYADPLDFYPGDEYVDWVGASSYMNQGIGAAGTLGNFSDAYYCFGQYDNQMVKLARVMESFGDRKPILISECGFCYRSDRSRQSEDYAARKLQEFYAAVNMVYPGVKAVLYFNSNVGGDFFKLSGSKKVKEAYDAAMKENDAISSTREGKPEGYTRLETLSEKRDSVPLYLYAAYPGQKKITVRYLFDKKEIASAASIPFRAELTKKMLTPGLHSLVVQTSCEQTKFIRSYSVLVSENGYVTVRAGASADDLDPDSALYEATRMCAEEGILTLREDGNFGPADAITGEELAAALACLAKIDYAEYLPGSGVSDADYRTEAAVAWALKNGLLTEKEDGVHSGWITENEVRAALYAFCRMEKITLPENGPDTLYRNDSIVTDDMREAVYFVRRTGLIPGSDAAAYRGPKPVRRENVAYALSVLRNAHKK